MEAQGGKNKKGPESLPSLFLFTDANQLRAGWPEPKRAAGALPEVIALAVLPSVSKVTADLHADRQITDRLGVALDRHGGRVGRRHRGIAAIFAGDGDSRPINLGNAARKRLCLGGLRHARQ